MKTVIGLSNPIASLDGSAARFTLTNDDGTEIEIQISADGLNAMIIELTSLHQSAMNNQTDKGTTYLVRSRTVDVSQSPGSLDTILRLGLATGQNLTVAIPFDTSQSLSETLTALSELHTHRKN